MGLVDNVRQFFGGSTRSETSSRAFRMRRGGGNIFEAAGGHALMPDMPEVGPLDPIRELRTLQRIARYLMRNNAWTQSLVRVLAETTVGTGPVPESRYPDLDDLWQTASSKFDSRGRGSAGRWLRMDVERNRIIDGETFVRRRSRFVRDSKGRKITEPGLIVPIQWQALTSDFVPVESDLGANPRKIAGVYVDNRGNPLGYQVHLEHPRSGLDGSMRTAYVPADEIYHRFDPETGAARGDVPLASALLRAIKLETLDNAELRRKIVASLASMIIEPSVDAAQMDESYIQDEETITRMIDDIDLVPGGIIRVPNGYKAKWDTPPDQGNNFESSYRLQLMQIAAAGGVAPHEVTGDFNGLTERMAKYLGLATKRRAEITRDDIEHQVLNPMRCDFIDVVMSTKQWTPPPSAKAGDLYACNWSWPIIQQASLTQELTVLMAATSAGHLPHGYISKNFFGLKPEEVARRSAKELARAQELGLSFTDQVFMPDTLTAARIAAEAIGEETTERDLVEEALLEDSPIIDGVKKALPKPVIKKGPVDTPPAPQPRKPAKAKSAPKAKM